MLQGSPQWRAVSGRGSLGRGLFRLRVHGGLPKQMQAEATAWLSNSIARSQRDRLRLENKHYKLRAAQMNGCVLKATGLNARICTSKGRKE